MIMRKKPPPLIPEKNKMITCKDCKKFAKVTKVMINGLDQIKVYGSCKHCGYINQLNKIDYDDFEELGVES